jgi:hypothetical protein
MNSIAAASPCLGNNPPYLLPKISLFAPISAIAFPQYPSVFAAQPSPCAENSRGYCARNAKVEKKLSIIFIITIIMFIR